MKKLHLNTLFQEKERVLPEEKEVGRVLFQKATILYNFTTEHQVLFATS